MGQFCPLPPLISETDNIYSIISRLFSWMSDGGIFNSPFRTIQQNGSNPHVVDLNGAICIFKNGFLKLIPTVLNMSLTLPNFHEQNGDLNMLF